MLDHAAFGPGAGHKIPDGGCVMARVMPRSMAMWALILSGFTATVAGGLLGVLVLAALGQPPVSPACPDDRAISVGRWEVSSAEWNGRPVDAEILAMLRVHFRADGSWAVLFKNIPVVEGKSTNRQDVSPKTFEMETLGSDGVEPSRFVGIYRLDGDARVLCFVPDDQPRPDEFAAPRHSGRMLVTLKRAMEEVGRDFPGRRSRGTHLTPVGKR